MFDENKLKQIKDKYLELEKQISDVSIVGTQKWTALVKEQSGLEELVNKIDSYFLCVKNIFGAKELLKIENDREMIELAEQEIKQEQEKKDLLETDIKILLLPKDADDDKNVIMEIRGGAGGEESSLFAYDLMRMYKMYAESNRWKIEDIDISMTELGGVKEAVFGLSGTNVFAKLKYESGVHRVQRVPETETQGRVHTSTVTVAVLPEREDIDVEILEKDLQIDTLRSGGAGGQHVNKTESAVRMTHLPTGIVVKCQDERSQIKNRDKAMKALKAKLYDYYRLQNDKEYAERRKNQVGTGDRSERIRTYNFSQGRVTDHRIGLTMYNLPNFLNGDINDMLEALAREAMTKMLNENT